MGDDKTESEVNAAAIAEFLAEGHEPDDEKTEAGETEPGEADDAADESEEASDTETGEESDEDAEETEDKPVDADLGTRLAKAVLSKDPTKLIAALGSHAEELLGSKAHKALRVQARELKEREAAHVKADTTLREIFGNPVAARQAATKGDADAFVECLERFANAPWTTIVKFVNDAQAGKPARLEAKAVAEAEVKKATNAKQEAAAKQVKDAIVSVVKKKDAALLKAHPRVVELVYDAMRAGFHDGVNTPVKALIKVRAELKETYGALTKVFGGKTTKAARTPSLRPPEPRNTPGKPQTEDEFRREFLRENGLGKKR